MKRIDSLFFLLLLSLTCTFTQAQNLIYKKIEQEKNNGKKFELVKDIFTKTESNREILRSFKNPDEVNFMNYNPSSVDELSRTISLEILLNNKTEILELIAVDNDFYNYVITTSVNESFSANRDIKHYRGIIQGNKNSLAAISFSKDQVGGIIANDKGNFNISLLDKGSSIITFNEDNLINIPAFECGTVDDGLANYDSNVLNLQSKTAFALNEKCVRLYLETEYDIFQNKGSILNVESYISTVFNQVSLLYEIEGIKTTISELKIWTTPDPYNGGDVYALLNEFKNHTSYMNGDLGQLLTFREVISGGLAYINVLCDPNHSNRTSVCGLWTSATIDKIYTWNVGGITHEFGHSLGSRHTHDCAWNFYDSNGNLVSTNIPLDRCGPNAGYGFSGSCSTTYVPTEGTIMSYCHLSKHKDTGLPTNNPGISFNQGFGQQPGNLIRSKVNGKACISSCSQYCFENLNLTSSVPLNYFDERKVSNNITATNKIVSGGYAEYSAGNSVILKPGFRSYSGSTSHIYIDGCTIGQNTISPSILSDQSIKDKELISEKLLVNLYPNPTYDVITIESNQEIIFWELTNDIGNIYKSGKVDHLKKMELNFYTLNKGVYNIKIHLGNGTFSYKKMIKQ